MITSWKHKGLKRFFESGDKSGIIAHHEKRLKIILQRLNAAAQVTDLNTPGMGLHKLQGDLAGFYAITVQANWRVVFKFNGRDIELVNYIDYH